ncbi:MAG: hypothetical protein AW08_00535 [Candidatus Accumulibacter adjunctus]|uniref:Uncharacterized protein n=1 Tax=Candidatus Accumulibacter adjunctus TaxID=1454001 RepID=A0A011N355_9PROT|nr:MAG: hypothetical protein AW08_00535 [Candidatus Accumulibacter adjunctus]
MAQVACQILEALLNFLDRGDRLREHLVQAAHLPTEGFLESCHERGQYVLQHALYGRSLLSRCTLDNARDLLQGLPQALPQGIAHACGHLLTMGIAGLDLALREVRQNLPEILDETLLQQPGLGGAFLAGPDQPGEILLSGTSLVERVDRLRKLFHLLVAAIQLLLLDQCDQHRHGDRDGRSRESLHHPLHQGTETRLDCFTAAGWFEASQAENQTEKCSDNPDPGQEARQVAKELAVQARVDDNMAAEKRVGRDGGPDLAQAILSIHCLILEVECLRVLPPQMPQYPVCPENVGDPFSEHRNILLARAQKANGRNHPTQ